MRLPQSPDSLSSPATTNNLPSVTDGTVLAVVLTKKSVNCSVKSFPVGVARRRIVGRSGRSRTRSRPIQTRQTSPCHAARKRRESWATKAPQAGTSTSLRPALRHGDGRASDRLTAQFSHSRREIVVGLVCFFFPRSSDADTDDQCAYGQKKCKPAARPRESREEQRIEH